METFHRLVRREKPGNGDVKKVMSSSPVPMSPDSYSSASSSAGRSHTRSSSISSFSNAFACPTSASKRSPRVHATRGIVESSTANSCDDWLLQPKQTLGFLHGSSTDEDREVPTKADDKKIKVILQRLANAGITRFKESDISHTLHAPSVDGDPEKAFSLMELYKDSEEGIVKPYDPSVKLLGAINREGTTCYLDSLLFAMFTRSGCFEAMLYTKFDDEKKQRLATLLRLWINALRSGRLITIDITKYIQLQLAECGWEDAAQVHQQDASEAFNFITEVLNLPLLTLKMDIFHHGREDAGDDHRFVNERCLEVAIPETNGSGLTLETCLTEYFNNRIEVKRYLQQRRGTLRSVRSQASFDSSSKGSSAHIETVECDDSLPSTPISPLPASATKRPAFARARAPSIIQESYVSEKDDTMDTPAYESPRNGRRRGGSLRKEVVMPAWQFFSLIPWYTDAKPSNDQQVAAHFHSARPMLGICLKRYSFLPNGQAKRNGTYIDIPQEIGLPHFIQDDNMAEDGPLFGNFKLALRSAICHQGTRVDSGHYIGLVRTYDAKKPGEDRWIRHDDMAKERVAEVDIDQFLHRETPYLLFYQVVPIEGDPGNIAEGEMDLGKDRPPPYTEECGLEAKTSPDQNPTTLAGEGEASDTSQPRTSNSSDRKRSLVSMGSGSTIAGTEPNMRKSIEDNGANSQTASRRSSRANGLCIANGAIAQAEPNSSRLSASMSRLTGRLTKDKSDNNVSIPPAGPSLEVRDAPGVHNKERPKKEKSKSKVKDHQHLSKGRGRAEKPDRECVMM
ncbi:MAG: hypothetical protein L6R36_007564 [Xanthoria steineri]|nr:MAG: hypothetical protein L6R36_007564 [Xanthoria steineri]